MLSLAALQGGTDLYPTTVNVQPPNAQTDTLTPRFVPPATVVGDPSFSHPVLLSKPPVNTDSTPPPGLTGAYGPSIGYGWSPPPHPTAVVNVPTSASDTSPTTLPTVTTWGAALTSHKGLIFALAIVVIVLFIAARRGR